MRQSLTAIFWKIGVGALIINAVWYFLALLFSIPSLPNPLKVYSHIPEVWTDGMARHVSASLLRISWGLVVALVLGLATALLMFRFRAFGKVMDAVVYFVYPVPKLALLPVVMLMAGLGDLAKVVMIVLIVLFQLILTLRDSLRLISPEHFNTLRSLGANEWQLFRHLLWPSVLPDMLSGLRVASGIAISVLFVTETYGTDRGMGFFIVDAWMRVDYLDMYVGIVILSLMGFLIFLFLDLVERVLTPWRHTSLQE